MIQLPSIKTMIVSSVDSLGTIHPNIYAFTFMFTFASVFMYIKIKHPFWNGEPVYHTYDFWRRWYSSPYIMHKQPLKTKYHQRQNVITVKAEDITIPQWRCIAEFLQYFSIPSDRVLHTITHTQIMSQYTSGHAHFSLCSVILPINEKEMGDNPTILAVVASKSATLTLSTSASASAPMPVYFINPIVTHRNHSTYVRTLFDTHVYRQRRMNPDVAVSVWKQEVTPVSGVVPLVQFSVETYYLGNVVGRLPANYQIQRIQSHNLSLIVDCWNNAEFTGQFDCILQTAPTALLSTVKSGLTWVFALTRKDHVYGLYYFKIPQLTYEALDDGKGSGGETIQCVATVCNCHDNLPLFYAGFLHCLSEMIKVHKPFQVLLIEWIGHTEYLADFWRKDYPTNICKNYAGYYLYNMIVPASPLHARRCFVFL